jgi:hypothetical protein
MGERHLKTGTAEKSRKPAIFSDLVGAREGVPIWGYCAILAFFGFGKRTANGSALNRLARRTRVDVTRFLSPLLKG